MPIIQRVPRTSRHSVLAIMLLALACLATPACAQTTSSLEPGAKPADAPQEWKQLVGIYLDEPKSLEPNTPKPTRLFILLEDGGKLFWRDDKGIVTPVTLSANSVFLQSEGPRIVGHGIARDENGNVEGLCYLNFCYKRSDPDGDTSRSVHIHPIRPVSELRNEALAASPPEEQGHFRKPELVELTTLDSAIRLDIRYATTNDFLGTPVYTQARAFLQRPAAEALVRALHKLEPLGYGLLIHDAYRPWYVTKVFWDATPPEGKIFVADPKEGSRHNRGCAVDLTLYDLKSGEPIEMPGTYDEMSPRSFPDYPGGTSLQRWYRDLLRRAMESEGFTVYEHEWWHFDYRDWREYPILNIKFEDLSSSRGLAEKK
ncbi:MAG TPA: M15 family metallopeptidase [Candidatus Acidoferrum sp.]|nr:M15 family metallopeptidase [Candidatus Acidoferrum sp.]